MKASVGTLGEASPRLQPDPGPISPPSEPAMPAPPLPPLEEEPLLAPVVVVPLLDVGLPELPLEERLPEDVEEPPLPSLTAALGALHAMLPTSSATEKIERERNSWILTRAMMCI